MIFGSLSILALLFVYFVVPELKGRSLEELDELFQSRTVPWRSTRFVSTGIGAEITNIERVKADSGLSTKAIDGVGQGKQADIK